LLGEREIEKLCLVARGAQISGYTASETDVNVKFRTLIGGTKTVAGESPASPVTTRSGRPIVSRSCRTKIGDSFQRRSGRSGGYALTPGSFAG
jgi:hypothetical protein